MVAQCRSLVLRWKGGGNVSGTQQVLPMGWTRADLFVILKASERPHCAARTPQSIPGTGVEPGGGGGAQHSDRRPSAGVQPGEKSAMWHHPGHKRKQSNTPSRSRSFSFLWHNIYLENPPFSAFFIPRNQKGEIQRRHSITGSTTRHKYFKVFSSTTCK